MSFHYINVMLYRAYAEMRAEVSNGLLGMSLWIIEPIVYMGAFYLIFAVIGYRGGVDAIPFLLPGLVVWKWFAAAVSKGSSSIMNGAHILQQIHVPKYVFIGTVLLTSFYHFLIIFFLLLFFLILYGIEPNVSWWGLIPVVLIQFLLIMGVAGVFASLMPYMPDLNIIVSNGLTLVFFLSGIFFDIGQSSAVLQTILYLNPMAVLVDSYRTILSIGESPNWFLLGYVFLFSFTMIVVTAFLLRKWEREYPKVLSQ